MISSLNQNLFFNNFFNYVTLVGFLAAGLINWSGWILLFGLIVEVAYLVIATRTRWGRTTFLRLLAGERRKMQLKTQLAALRRLTRRSQERFAELNRLKFRLIEALGRSAGVSEEDEDRILDEMDRILQAFLDLAQALFRERSKLGRENPDASWTTARRGRAHTAMGQAQAIEERLTDIESAFHELAEATHEPDFPIRLTKSMARLASDLETVMGNSACP